jgi:type VI protein secretion system component VasK
MFFIQGGKDLHEASFSGNAVDEADVQYAGPDFALQFKDLPQGPIIQTETFSGPWAPFRLLVNPNTKSVTRDGTKSTVDYLVTDANKKVWSLWLQLDFKVEVPDLKDWPVPPGAK